MVVHVVVEVVVVVCEILVVEDLVMVLGYIGYLAAARVVWMMRLEMIAALGH